MTSNKDHRKKKPIISIAFVVVGLLLVGGIAIMLLAKPRVRTEDKLEAYISAIPIPVEFPAPALNLTDLQGKPVSLLDYSGRTVLVNNWAFWCPPCQAELPTLQDYFEDHNHQNFILIGIEAGGDLVPVENYAKEYGLTYPIWLDPKQTAIYTFQNINLPNSYVIDPEGMVRLFWNGAISREMLEEHVTPLLEQ